ncbi:MAG: short-chain dehydrogenase/reductase [Dehalococcoidia bacterium]|nr:short-chain dehydrogenase/reductase [Dehalococcoidia bacterium]
MTGRLEGKTAFVTGSASGIGRAIATVFAREGACVTVADVNEEGGNETVRLIAAEGSTAKFIRTDVTSEDNVREAIETTAGVSGRLDVLVNNAGIVHMAGVIDTKVEDWERVLNTNLRGMFFTSKHAIPYMQKQGGGAIVNIASIGSLVGILAHAAYNASKGGVVALSRQMAVDYGPNNIRINCVCPTATDTPLIRNAGAGRRALQSIADGHPLRRIAQPEDIAWAVLFLASDEARCITGAVLPVDAGWTAV